MEAVLHEVGKTLPSDQHNTESAGAADVNTLLSPGELTAENVSVDDIGTQLISVGSIQEEIRTQIWKLEGKHFETTVLKLKSILPRLDSLKGSLRETLAAHAGPRTREPHILRLPDELLTKISEDVRGDLISEEDDQYSTAGIGAIKNLRLTCRRFCDASSHLLLQRLGVALTSSSLQRLEMVSRHPTFSKGIRSLQICASVYDPRLASDLQSFVTRLLNLLKDEYEENLYSLEQYVETFVRNRDWGVTRTYGFEPSTKHAFCNIVDFLEQYRRIVPSCDDILGTQTYQSDEASKIDAFRKHFGFSEQYNILGSQTHKDQTTAILHHAYNVYVQLVKDQDELLANDKVVGIVTEAVARMPAVTGLSITDNLRFELHLPLNGMSGPIYDAVRERLLQPRPWDTETLSVLSQRPVNLLHKLPLAFVRAGKPLTKLRIRLNPTLDPHHEATLSDELCKDLANAAEGLEVLDVDCDINSIFEEVPPQFIGEPGQIPKLASIFLKGTNLVSVTLHFFPWYDEPFYTRVMDGDSDPETTVHPPSVEWLPWVNIKRISLLNGLFDCDDLCEYLNKMKPGTCIFLRDVKLRSGLWSNLIDLIRAKGGSHSNVIEPHGTAGESNRRFREAFEHESGNAWFSPVNAYIRGQLTDNPLRTSQGDLGSDSTDEED